jgi:fumarylacetoacetate (FAA) hydrolase
MVKLGTLKNEQADGRLVVVSWDQQRARLAGPEIPTLRFAVENWSQCKDSLAAIYRELNAGRGSNFVPDMGQFHSPLPRAFGFLDGSAYLQHVRLVRRARGAELPTELLTRPLMYQGLSDGFLAPTDAIPMQDESFGLDFEGEVGVITSFVPMATPAHKAEAHILLVVLINDVSLRGLIPEELAQGFGFMQSKPASSFAPLALTPDELAPYWRDARLHLPLAVTYNSRSFGNADAGEMHFGFHELIAHAARTRCLCAGHILGSGTVSNQDASRGASCLAEIRMLEQMERGRVLTPFMAPGDHIRMEMFKDGVSLFGAIDQTVQAWPSTG